MVPGADGDPDTSRVVTTDKISGWQRKAVDLFEEWRQFAMAVQLEHAAGNIPQVGE